MARNIDVDDEVYAWLQRHARPFEDTPNCVLRRLAGLDPTHGIRQPEPVSLEERDRSLKAQQPTIGGKGKVSRRAGKVERRQVIDHYGLLEKSRHGKICEDVNGTLYVVFVGYGKFHGISRDMISLISKRDCGKLVIGKCLRDSIRLYEGSIPDLRLHIEELSLSKKSHARNFHIAERDGHVFIKEAPSVRLEFAGQIDPA